MKAQNRGIFMIFQLVLLLVAALVVHPVAVARADFDPKANTPTPTQIRSFADLPPGLAPAVARALQDDLPVAYRLSKTGANFLADNPAHGMHFTFTPAGLRVRGPNGGWGMALSKWGRAGAAQPVPAARLAAKRGRLEYRRDPILTEWYLNTAWGLEQGFTLNRRPSATDGRPSPVVLELALSGTVRPHLQDDDPSTGSGKALLLHDVGGQPVARYTGLYAYDSDGKALPAHLSLSPGGEGRAGGETLRISVDDSAARYPITIDPWFQTAKLLASDGVANDLFGTSVAISGDTVVVGAKWDDDNGGNSGSAYVFAKPGGGWTDMNQTAKLTASDGTSNDVFGTSVAISGDTVVVGAPYRDGGGSAYIFVKPGGGWSGSLTETTKLLASDRLSGDWLGERVAISGDTVVAGARGDDDNGSASGSAYVFVMPGGGWAGTLTHTAKLTASDGATTDEFGCAVAISGDTVVVGAHFDDDKGNGSGSAYVFVKPGGGWSGSLTQDAKLTASDGLTGDGFGDAVAISGDTVLVGARYDDIGGNDVQGSAYVFERQGGGWAEAAKLTASDGVAYDEFGSSVSISGDTVVVGAASDSIGANHNQGSAYVFAKPVGGWADMTETAKLTASDGDEADGFGGSVGISGDTVVAGAAGDDDNGSASGSAYIFFPLDSDGDGIPDYIEDSGCTDTYDADTDEDGIIDGVEDANHDGLRDEGETDPCNIDSDGDGIQDGTESGYTLDDIGPDTDTGVFQPDLDPTTKTDPLDDDTDNDGLKDGEEETNHNGRVDPGERDPNRSNRGSFPWLLLFED